MLWWCMYTWSRYVLYYDGRPVTAASTVTGTPRAPKATGQY